MNGTTPIIIGKSDFCILKRYMAHIPVNEFPGSLLLSRELNAAIVVEDEILPKNCVRLNSIIKVREWPSNKVLEFSIVLPETANLEKKGSLFLIPGVLHF